MKNYRIEKYKKNKNLSMAYRIVVIDYSFSFSVKKAVKLYVAIFFSVKKKRRNSLLDNSMWIISCIVAIDQNAFGVSYSRWRQQRLSR